MDARVIISKETQEKLNKPLNAKQKGELRMKRLREIANTGEISKAKTKWELAKMCGYTERERSNGYAWVMYLIRQKKIIETIVAYNQYGKAEYEYALNFEKSKPNPLKETFKVAEPTRKPDELVENKAGRSENIIMTIRKGDTEIKVENGGQQMVVEIIKLIVKG